MAVTAQTEDRRSAATMKVPFRFPWHYLGKALIYLWLTFMAVYALLPLSWMFSTSLRLPAESFELPPSFLPTSWRWDNWLAVLTSEEVTYPLFFLNSFKMAGLITGLQLLTGSMAAFGFARLRFRGRDSLFFLLLAAMMIPNQVTSVPRFVIIRVLKLYDTHWALILPAATGVFGIFLLRQHFMKLPSELMDSARIDGAGFFEVLSIMLPLVGPGLSALGVFTFLGSWNNFYGPLLYLRTWDKFTLPLALVILAGYMGDGSRAEVLAAIFMSIIPVLTVFLLAQRFVVRGIALTGLKG